MKRILTIQDISCIGKCSLTVALPIISAMGVETAIVPTVVLSTHTMFPNFTSRDLTDDLKPIKEHWKRENFRFDAIYTGYLGSKRQIQPVKDYFETFGNDNNYIIVDPAMADNGKLYVGFDDSFAKAMGQLCRKANIILPNISEACLLLGENYPGEEVPEKMIKDLLIKLTGLGCTIPVITGVTLKDGTFGFMGYDTVTQEYFCYGTKKIPLKSHGTGDVFASAFTGALINGFSVFRALKIAADYTCACIKNSYNDPNHVNYAINFEAEIPYLLELINE